MKGSSVSLISITYEATMKTAEKYFNKIKATPGWNFFLHRYIFIIDWLIMYSWSARIY